MGFVICVMKIGHPILLLSEAMFVRLGEIVKIARLSVR